jgi:hypothetical protein
MQPSQPTGKQIAIVIGGAILLWIIAWVAMLTLLPDYQTRGQFGDMFGAVNSLFSGLAMAGVIYTVWLQTKEIEAQREEQRANEAFRQTQLESVNLNVATLREQLQLMKMGGAPAIQWHSIVPGPKDVSYTFINKGGRIKMTEVRVLNSPIIGADWSRLFVSTDERGTVKFSFVEGSKLPFPSGGLLFELHYTTTYGPEYRKYRVLDGKLPIEEG